MSGDEPIGLTPDPNRPGSAANVPPVTPRPVPKPPPPVTPKPPTGAIAAGLAGLRVSLMPTEGEGGGLDPRRRALILLFVLVLESLVIGGFGIYFEKSLVSRRAAKATLEAEVKTLEVQVTTAAQQITSLERLDRQAGVDLETLDKHARWTNLFVFIEQNTRPNITIENFSGVLETGLVTLNLVGQSYRDLAEQIVLLREQPAVDQVRVTSAAAKMGAAGVLEGVYAVLTMKLEPALWLAAPQSSAVPAVPASSPTAPANPQ